MLLKGDAQARVRTAEIRFLPCSDHLKEIVYRCIGARRKRYESADELIAALRNPPAELKAGALRSLKGVHLAFTGILSRPRREAVRAARRAGALVHGRPSARTTVVVRGPAQPAAGGRAGGRAQAHGDQAPPREGAADHPAEGGAVLAAGRPALILLTYRSGRSSVTTQDGVAADEQPLSGSSGRKTRLAFGPPRGGRRSGGTMTGTSRPVPIERPRRTSAAALDASSREQSPGPRTIVIRHGSLLAVLAFSACACCSSPSCCWAITPCAALDQAEPGEQPSVMARVERKLQQLESGIGLRLEAAAAAARDARPHHEGEPAREPGRRLPLRRAGPERQREVPVGRPAAPAGHRHGGEPLRPAGHQHGRRARPVPDLAVHRPDAAAQPGLGATTTRRSSTREKNTEAAALYLDILFTTYSDPQLVLAEYNGGPLNAGYFRAGVGRAGRRDAQLRAAGARAARAAEGRSSRRDRDRRSWS